jgi:hypothetical protein
VSVGVPVERTELSSPEHQRVSVASGQVKELVDGRQRLRMTAQSGQLDIPLIGGIRLARHQRGHLIKIGKRLGVTAQVRKLEATQVMSLRIAWRQRNDAVQGRQGLAMLALPRQAGSQILATTGSSPGIGAPVDAFLAVVQEICGGDAVAADALATALEATAHGYAVLLPDDESGTGPDAIAAAADRPPRPRSR